MSDAKAAFDKIGEDAHKERQSVALEAIASSLTEMAADMKIVRVVLQQMNNKN